MKKTVFKSLVLFLISFIVFIGTVNAAEPSVTVFVDGEQIIFDVEPIIEDGRTLVPMRYIFEALGAEVNWVAETSTAVAVKGDIIIEITADKNEMIKNGSTIILDVPAKIKDGRTLVPVRAVSEGMEATVDWDGKNRKVIITSGNVVKSEYNYTQLSNADSEKIREMAYDFRYLFEQQILPGVIFSETATVAEHINVKSKELSDVIFEIWDGNVASLILEVQLKSEDSYVFDEQENIDEEEILDNYRLLSADLGMDSESNFTVSYDTTPGGKTVLFLTFFNTEFDEPFAIVSKHIAVAEHNGESRYFTGEISLFPEGSWMFCEITPEGRKNYGLLDATTKEAFLKKIDSVLK